MKTGLEAPPSGPRPSRHEAHPGGPRRHEITPRSAKSVGEPAVEAVVENPTWAISAEALVKQRESEKARQIPLADNRARKRGLEKAAEDAAVFTKFQAKLDRRGIKGKSTPIHKPSEQAKLQASLELQLKTQRQESGRIPIAPVKGIGNRIRQNKDYRREMKIAESDAAELAELLTKPEEQIKREAARRASREAMKDRIKLEARRAAKSTAEHAKQATVRGAKFTKSAAVRGTKFAVRSAAAGGRAGMRKFGEKREEWAVRRETKQAAKDSAKSSVNAEAAIGSLGAVHTPVLEKVSTTHTSEDAASKLNEWAAEQAETISKINASQSGEATRMPAPGEINPTAGESIPEPEPIKVESSEAPRASSFSDSVAELNRTVAEDTPRVVPSFSDSVAELNSMVGDEPEVAPETSVPEVVVPVETIRPDAVIASGESRNQAQPLDDNDFNQKVV